MRANRRRPKVGRERHTSRTNDTINRIMPRIKYKVPTTVWLFIQNDDYNASELFAERE